MTDSIEITIKRVQHECDKMRALDIGSVQLPIMRVEALLEHVAKLEADLDAARDRVEALLEGRRG